MDGFMKPFPARQLKMFPLNFKISMAKKKKFILLHQPSQDCYPGKQQRTMAHTAVIDELTL